MTDDVCSCSQPGFCERRGCVLTGLHFRRCQAGEVEMLDKLYQEKKPAAAPVRHERADRAESRKVQRIPDKTQRRAKHREKSQPRSRGERGRVHSFLSRVASRAESLKKAAVDFLADGMTIATTEQQNHRDAVCYSCPILSSGWCDFGKGGCGCNVSLKIKARAAFCPQGKWFAYHDFYQPLIAPTRSLIFHVYPLNRRSNWWRWHVEQIRKHADKFNGKIVIGMSLGSETATAEEVYQAFAGIPVSDWIVKQNSPMAETLTHVEMLEKVQTDDPHSIVFRYHTKGVTKQPGAVEERWAELLWEANTHLPSVEDALASHLTCGAMRSLTPLVQRKPGDFFFAGSAYWFRAKEAFERDWRHTDATRWWVEYFPTHVFTRAESASLLYDFTESSVIRADHFATHIQPEWDAWRRARGIA